MKKNYLFILVVLSSPLVSMSQSTLNFKLLEAAETGTAGDVQNLILQGADPLATPSIITHRQETALMVALASKNEGACRVLINYRFAEQAKKRGFNGYTLMHYAAGNHCIEVFQGLKTMKINDINECHNDARETPLIRAIEGNTTEEKKLQMIKALIEAGANPSIGEEDAFTVARRQPFPINEKILALLE